MEIRKEFRKAVAANQYEVMEDGGLYLPRQKAVIAGKFGSEVWRDGELIMPYEENHNIVTNEGLNHMLDVVLHATAANATWYAGIFKGNYTPLATDTGANIAANSTEATEYSEATRVEYVEAASASQSITNSANKATFTINATVTIYGAFLASTNTKSGTSGVCFAASKFSSSRDLVLNDELLVTYTVSATST